MIARKMLPERILAVTPYLIARKCFRADARHNLTLTIQSPSRASIFWAQVTYAKGYA
jgi:hypothetical protein